MDECSSLFDVMDDNSPCVKKIKSVPGNIIDKYRNWQVTNVGDINHLTETFSFFGITEYFYASLCLMYYTFHDTEKFSHLCKDAETNPRNLVPHKNTKDQRFNYSERNLDNSELKARCSIVNNRDFDLYKEAIVVFRKRVKAMERETGTSGYMDIVKNK